MSSTIRSFSFTIDDAIGNLDEMTWSRWVDYEPGLMCISSYHDLAQLMTYEPNLRDTVIISLLRLSDVDGHDDPLATQTLIAVLTPGLGRLVRFFHQRGIKAAHNLVESEAWIALRTPSPHWTNASSVMWSIKRSLSRQYLTDELTGDHTTDAMGHRDLNVDTSAGSCEGQIPSKDDSSVQKTVDRLSALMAWARARGMSATLLSELDQFLDYAAQAQVDSDLTVAAAEQHAFQRMQNELGVCRKTLRRRRLRAVANLQQLVRDANDVAAEGSTNTPKATKRYSGITGLSEPSTPHHEAARVVSGATGSQRNKTGGDLYSVRSATCHTFDNKTGKELRGLDGRTKPRRVVRSFKCSKRYLINERLRFQTDRHRYVRYLPELWFLSTYARCILQVCYVQRAIGRVLQL